MTGRRTPADDPRAALAHAGRVLVKIGSAVLTGPDGLDGARIEALAGQISRLRNAGREVVVVSSGAIAAGVRRMGLTARPRDIPGKQAAAAVGQGLLVRAWDEAFARLGTTTAQVLLTADDLAHRHRYLNARHTLETLLAWRVVPVINENDTVMVDEIKFGDNDQLAALIAGLVGADATVILSDVDALYDADPHKVPTARPIPWVRRWDASFLDLAGSDAGALGTGGMRSKLLAAQKCLSAGIPLLIASGTEPDVLVRALSGEPVGTLFAGRTRKFAGCKLWLAHLPRPSGDLVVDEGAARALREGGTSLLPVGVASVSGHFGVGAPVRCLDPEGRVVGIGLVNYDAAEIERIRGCRTAEIEARLGYRHSDEVIHRDHFALAGE